MIIDCSTIRDTDTGIISGLLEKGMGVTCIEPPGSSEVTIIRSGDLTIHSQPGKMTLFSKEGSIGALDSIRLTFDDLDDPLEVAMDWIERGTVDEACELISFVQSNKIDRFDYVEGSFAPHIFDAVATRPDYVVILEYRIKSRNLTLPSGIPPLMNLAGEGSDSSAEQASQNETSWSRFILSAALFLVTFSLALLAAATIPWLVLDDPDLKPPTILILSFMVGFSHDTFVAWSDSLSKLVFRKADEYLS